MKSALDSALKYYDWETVVKCYTMLNLREKAAEVIRGELEKSETTTLLCMLGEVTNEVAHYEKALEKSNGKSARAHRQG